MLTYSFKIIIRPKRAPEFFRDLGHFIVVRIPAENGKSHIGPYNGVYFFKHLAGKQEQSYTVVAITRGQFINKTPARNANEII